MCNICPTQSNNAAAAGEHHSCQPDGLTGLNSMKILRYFCILKLLFSLKEIAVRVCARVCACACVCAEGH